MEREDLYTKFDQNHKVSILKSAVGLVEVGDLLNDLNGGTHNKKRRLKMNRTNSGSGT